MGRLMAIDYGRRRCGIAVTDPLRIVATGLSTVRTCDLAKWVADYILKENVDAIIVGKPSTMRGEDSESMNYIRPGIAMLRKVLPKDIEITYWDERFTSVLAHRAMIDSGMRKSRRRDKAVVDEIAATIILNDYLQSKQFNQ
ncbi:Holliday junction resolvase RuvX [Muribaculum intestinale]|uniref:Holliday junction resolvase RuvX n=1 Tax=Muribaculum intestinale TaxID=1796646 RepID=UPI0025A959E2|nr:Holliday junction resolvase RuvX [Muribaculum intestinale]